MANPHRGEAEITIGEKTYTLVIGRNALAEAEAVVGKAWSEISGELQAAPSFGLIRALFWAALRRKHPEITLLDAGDLMDEVDDKVLGEKIGEALERAFPDVEKGDNPQQPERAGAGKQT